METRNKQQRNSKRKKAQKKPEQILSKLELFHKDVTKNISSALNIPRKDFKSLLEVNNPYALPDKYIYEEALNLAVELVHSLDHHRLKILISDVEKLNHNVVDFFQDCFSRLRAESEDIPLPNQIQWLANWAQFLLFNEDKSSRYTDVESNDFKQFIICMEKNYHDSELPLSLRVRFGLLIAYSYIIPAFNNINCDDFEINPRATQCPFKISPNHISVDYNTYGLQMFLFWMEKLISQPATYQQDILNLQADCKELVKKFNWHFLPQVCYTSLMRMGQAFFSAADKYQSCVYPTGPDKALGIKKGI